MKRFLIAALLALAAPLKAQVVVDSTLKVDTTQHVDTAWTFKLDSAVAKVDTTWKVDSTQVVAKIDTVTHYDSAWTPVYATADSLKADVDLAGLAAFRDPSTVNVVELPRVRMPINVPAVKRTLRVTTTAQLQAALDNAQTGDEILLPQGAVFGNVTLKPRGGLYRIRTEGAKLPFGVRADSVTAVEQRWAIIRTTSTLPAIATSGAASGAHFSTVRIEATASNGGVVRLGNSSISRVEQLPAGITFDRVIIRSVGTAQTKRCIEANARRLVVISSSLLGCKNSSSQVQGVAAWNTSGEQRYQNNLIEGSAQNMLFGGADPKLKQAADTMLHVRPCDIEIRGNYFLKPREWQNVYLVATNWETKNGCRMLIAENVFENSWGDAQVGTLWNLKTSNQSGTCNDCESSHQTFMYNVLRSAPQALQLQGCEHYTGGTCVATNHFRIDKNVIEDISGSTTKTATIATVTTFKITNNVWDIRNTVNADGTVNDGKWQHAFYCIAPSSKIVVTGNVYDPASYSFKDCGTQSPDMIKGGNVIGLKSTLAQDIRTEVYARTAKVKAGK